MPAHTLLSPLPSLAGGTATGTGQRRVREGKERAQGSVPQPHSTMRRGPFLFHSRILLARVMCVPVLLRVCLSMHVWCAYLGVYIPMGYNILSAQPQSWLYPNLLTQYLPPHMNKTFSF